VKWDSGAALVSSPALGLVCASATPAATVYDSATNNYATDHVLLVGHMVTCTGSCDFTQAVFESVSGGTKEFNIALPAVAGWTYSKAGGTASDPKTFTASVSIARSFTVQIGACTLPLNATSKYLQQIVVAHKPHASLFPPQWLAGCMVCRWPTSSICSPTCTAAAAGYHSCAIW
jgi:hypothetical protein